MRIGKVAKQIEYLKEHLDKGETILMAGMKDPTVYLDILGDSYMAEESFRTSNMNRVYDDISGAVYWDGGERIKTGYIFRKG